MSDGSEKFRVPTSHRIRWQDIALGGVLLLAFFLRLFKYSSRPVFADEEATINLAGLNAIELWVNVPSMDPHPPIYYLFSRYWGEITNLTITNLRLTSVFFGTVAVYGMYRIGRLLYSEFVGLSSSLLLAVSPHHIASSQYARSYALFSLLTIYSFYYFWKLKKSSSASDLIGYILFTTLMASVHIYGSFLVFGQWIYFATAHFKLESKIPVRRFVKSQLGTGLLFIPSFLVIIQAARFRIGGSVGDITHANFPTPRVVVRTIGTFTGGRYSLHFGAVLLGLLMICILLFIYHLITDVRNGTESESATKTEQRVFILCWGVSVLFVPILISYGLVNIWDGRSTSGALLALILAASDGIYHVESTWVRIGLPVLLVVTSVLVLPAYYSCYAAGFFC